MASTFSSHPFPEQAFDYLASAESRHWWFLARNQIIIWVLRKKVRTFANFLEVGCGTGFVISGIAKAFPELEVEASEYFEDGLVFARKRLPQCKFRKLDATAMVEEKAYDCIGCFDVIEHIDADERVLSNFNRALRSGGFLLLTVPQHPWLWSAADDYAHHIRRYTYLELRRKILRARFKIEFCTSFVSLLLPIMAFQRLSSKNKGYSLNDELKVNYLTNLFLYLVMQVELILLKLGIRFSLGGSLLLLARKA
jgi:SAM-dependent methyltransferase